MAPSFSKLHGGRSPSLLRQTECKRNRARLPLVSAIALACGSRHWQLANALSLPERPREARFPELPIPEAPELDIVGLPPRNPRIPTRRAPSSCPVGFIEAVKRGDAGKVKELLAANTAELKGCAISFGAGKHPSGREVMVTGTALHLAAYTNQTEVLQALLDEQVDVNTATYAGAWILARGTTALMLASWANSLEVVNVLLAVAGIRVNDRNEVWGYSALVFATWKDNAEVVRALLKVTDININISDKEGHHGSALHWAAYFGHDKVTRELLERKDLEVNLQDGAGRSALIIAAEKGHVEVVQVLLERQDLKCNLQSKEEGETALFIAARAGKVEVVRALLAKKDSDLNVTLADQAGNSPLAIAVSFNRPEVVELLVEDDRTAVDQQNEDGMTPMMMAILRSSREMFDLVCRTSDPALPDKDGAIALVYAADNSLKWVQEVFVECFFEVDYRAGFLSAIRSGHTKALEELGRSAYLETSEWCDCRADGNAMLCAVRAGRIQIMHWLFGQNKHIDLRCHDEDGNTDLVLAVKHGHYLPTKFLLDNGLSLKTDIDHNDTKAKQLALWMGVAFSEPRLVGPFVESGMPWVELWEKPADCPEADMKETCTDGVGSLMAHVRSGSLVHDLLDWQFNVEKNEGTSEEAIYKHRVGLTTESKQEILAGLAYMLKNDRSEPALALLSRIDWNWPEELRNVADLPNDTLLVAKDSENKVTLGEAKCWNLLHWAAFSCDINALSIAMKFTTRDLVKLVDSEPSEGATKTASEIVRDNQHCFRSDSIFTEIMETWIRQRNWRFFGGYFTTIASVGALFLHLFFLQPQSLKKRGWLFMSTIPLPLSAAGFFLVRMPAERGEGICSISVTSDKLKGFVGWSAIVSGGVLFLGVSALFAGPRPMLWLLSKKKKCTDKLDRFWEKASCGLAVLLLIVFVLEAAVLLEMGLAVDIAGVLSGLAHTVATCLPLFMANPRWISVPLRLAPGICFVGLIIYIAARSQPITRLWSFVSEGGMVLIATCFALAWADSTGMFQRGVQMVVSVIEIEMSAKQAQTSNERFTAGKLVLGHPAFAAQGLEAALGLTPEQMSEGLKDPIEAMRREIIATENLNDLENFDYIVEGTSGCPSDLPSAVAESLRTGVYHGGTIQPGDFDTGHDGRTLDDWMLMPEVIKANLSKAEFVAVRFYTSSSFPRINGPLRQEVRPHPWAMVVFLLDRGIKKLRAVQAQVNPKAFAGETTLWRGMKNLEVDVHNFASVGGTEMAPMSTTTNEEVARHYATSKVPLVFKFVVGGLKTGVSIQFLSMYPKEEEFLYSPLTFLSLKNSYEDDGTTILVVEPVMS